MSCSARHKDTKMRKSTGPALKALTEWLGSPGERNITRQCSKCRGSAPRAIETPRRQSVNLSGEVRMQGNMSCVSKETPMWDWRCRRRGASLVVQWLRLEASNAGGMGSIPAQGTKILHATQHGQKINKDTERMQWIEFDVGCVEFNGPVDHSSRRVYQMGTWKH